MKPGKTEQYLYQKRDEMGALFFGLIDPIDHPSLEKGIAAARATAEAGADVILVGGSIGAQGDLLDNIVSGIKKEISVPTIIFPGNIATISKHADAIYFMSLLNSREPYWITLAQTLAAPTIKTLPVEPLPVGYIVIEPGGTVGWVGDANKIPQSKPHIASAMALAGQYMGSRFILTDVGSASPKPVPKEMVKAVSSAIDVFYIVAGGIRTEKQVRDAVKNGADAIQVGTAIERKGNIQKLIRACHAEGKKRLR